MILHKVYTIIKGLHEEGQPINRGVVRSLVENQSRIVDKDLATGILVGWSIQDNIMEVSEL